MSDVLKKPVRTIEELLALATRDHKKGPSWTWSEKLSDAEQVVILEWYRANFPQRDSDTRMLPPYFGFSAMPEGDLCKCGKNPKTFPHTCPYAADVGNDPNPDYCTCCSDCERVCGDDV